MTDDDIFRDLQIAGAHRALVFRSGRLWQVEAAVSGLKERLPLARIDILCQPSALEQARALPGVDAAIPYSGEKFELLKTPLPLILRLRRRKYDVAVLVFNNVYGEDYEDIRALAALTGARRQIAYNLDGHWLELTQGEKLSAFSFIHISGAAVLAGLYLPFGVMRMLAARAGRHSTTSHRGTR